MNIPIKAQHIAPCGMNCRLCIGFIREKNRCDGCMTENSKCSRKCIIRFCVKRKPKDKYCFSCDSFPCTRLKNLDKRYRTNYGMSMINNLNNIKEQGIRKFIKIENSNWVCPGCGEIYCIHRTQCINCGSIIDKKLTFN